MSGFDVATSRNSRRRALMGGVSLLAVLGGMPALQQAHAATLFRSLSQALATAPRAAIGATVPTAGGLSAMRQAQSGAQSLATAARLMNFRSMAQVIAGRTGSAIPDGLGPNSLQPAGTGGGLWIGAAPNPAATPDTATAGITDVTVQQTSNVASLTWRSFNVGAHTKLVFNQGASSWVVINKLADPNAPPSQILGAISAPGKVYVLNRNGVLFGAGSQVNVGSLVAATANIAASQFGTDALGNLTFSLYGKAATGGAIAPSFTGGSPTGFVTVEQGASINTALPLSASSGGGYVMLFGGTVSNSGAITTPLGQTVLAAGTDFILRPGYSPTANATSTTLGSEVAVTNSSQAPSRGLVVNNGYIFADFGDVTLVGHTLVQAGGVAATTSVNTRGTVHLLTDTSDHTASVVLAQNSVTAVLPSDNGQTALASPAGSTALNQQRATGQLALNDSNRLADLLGASRIEISTGGSVDFQPNSLASASGGVVAVGAGTSILVDNFATIDVSGGAAATLPASANELLVNLQPYQLRDSAANRVGGLDSGNVYVDARTLVGISSGPYAGNVYTPGGLVEASGYLGLVGHTIGQTTSFGGQVILQAGTTSTTGTVTTTTGTITTAPLATIDLQGGLVTYLAGPVRQSYVQTLDGRIYNVNYAPGNLVYAGVYNGVVVQHPRWHVTQNFVNPLLTPATINDPGYTVGHNAGTLTVSAPSLLLQGSVLAGVTPGVFQAQLPISTIVDPLQQAQTALPSAGSLQIGSYLSGILVNTAGLGSPNSQFSTNFVFTDTGGATMQSPAPGTALIDARQQNADGFGSVSVVTNGDIAVDAPLAVAPGGQLSLYGGSLEVDAGLSARGGTITLSDVVSLASTQSPALTPNLTVLGMASSPIAVPIAIAPGVSLDTSGLWTNAFLDPANIATAALARGGSIVVRSARGLNAPTGVTLDVSSGGGISSLGQPVTASGGNIGITADFVGPGLSTNAAPVVFAPQLVGYGSGGGGTLSITGPSFRIADASSAQFVPSLAATLPFAPPPGGTLVTTTGTGFGLIDPGSIAAQLPILNTVTLDPGVFQSGFSAYVVNGFNNVEVAQTASGVQPAMPIYLPNNNAPLVPTGGDPQTAYAIFVPPLYNRPSTGDSFTQRAGASLTLESVTDPSFPAIGNSGGAVVIDAGAAITVDPLASVAIDAYGQVTVLGTLTAHGGTVKVQNVRYEMASSGASAHGSPLNYVAGQSVWIGDHAVLDASGAAVVFTDAAGLRFGAVNAGGTIALGGAGGASASSLLSTDSQIILRPGAVVNASGTTATVDLVPSLDLDVDSLVAQQTPIKLASAGGTIVARSYTGIALDGRIEANAGAANAAGGVLILRADPLGLEEFNNIPVVLLHPKQILLSNSTTLVQPISGLQPGQITPDYTVGLVRLSQDQINTGGFDQISLFAQSNISFEGSFTLQAARSITLDSGIVGATAAQLPGLPISAKGADIVRAPYVSLIGYSLLGPNGYNNNDQQMPNATALAGAATLTVEASLIDLQNQQFIGGKKVIADPTAGQTTFNIVSNGTTIATTSTFGIVVPGFTTLTLQSSGDIRWVGAVPPQELVTTGNLVLDAGQIYPATSATGTFVAGFNPAATATENPYVGGTISIAGNGAAAPPPPFSVGGTLAFLASTVLQDGIVRAPEGNLRFGVKGNDLLGGTGTPLSNGVTFGAGGITSVSLDGQTIPYGGTVDGTNYLYAGKPVSTFTPTVEIDSRSFVAAPGATLDLSGGGTLSGAGFVAGRGGSTDVLRTPLLANTASGSLAVSNSGTPVNAGDAVFAILPGYQSSYAPVAPGDAYTAADGTKIAYSTPMVGEQIVVGNQVPGLPAGTYTLLPAYYALLPGGNGFRVEFAGSSVTPLQVASLGNFTVVAPATVHIANTGIFADLPVAALFTSAQGVAQLSQYNTQAYSDFEIAAANVLGTPRPFLPQDAKTLFVDYPSLRTAGIAFSVDPAALLQTPGQAGAGSTSYGMTVEIDAPGTSINIVGNDPADKARSGIVLDAAALDGLHAPRLVIGGTVQTVGNEIVVKGDASAIIVSQDASLSAGEVLLTTIGGASAASGGTISLLSSKISAASISTINNVAAAFDTANSRYYFSDGNANGSFPLLDVSNGNIVFAPNGNATFGQISIGNGVQLLAGGSLNVVAPLGTSVSVGTGVRLAGKNVDLAVSAVNILAANLTGFNVKDLPTGLTLTDSSLGTLLAGDPANGIPAVGTLQITAAQDVNIVGAAALNFGSTALVLDTPALYGFGALGDQASLTAASVTWSGIDTLFLSGNFTLPNFSALPGGQIAGSATHVAGGLTISAAQIVLGFGAQALATDQVQLDRLIAGYGTVTLQASQDITANNKSSLSVYSTITTFGQPGTLGNLVLATPLLTAASGAQLKLTAGGAISLLPPAGAAPAAPAGITTLGGEIDLLASSITLNSTVALPAGRLMVTAQQDISIDPGAVIDLSGRATPIFDQVAQSPGGTLVAESTAGNFTDAGTINLSSPGASAGSISISALGTAGIGGLVTIAGAIDGLAAQASSTNLASPIAGSFSVIAGTLGGGAGAFDALNALLDAGQVYGGRNFEIANGNIVVDHTIKARNVSLIADTGSLDVIGAIDASGAGPGRISLSAGTTLTLERTAFLDAKANSIAHDSYYLPIDAENRAHVSLTAAASGSIVLIGGARIDVSYPTSQVVTDASGTHTVTGDGAQGQVVLNAPRVSPDGNVNDANSLAITADTGAISVNGAAGIDLFGVRHYAPTDPYGTIAQNAASATKPVSGAIVTFEQINLDNQAFAGHLGANAAALQTQLSGLLGPVAVGLLPGVEIDSSVQSNNNLTLTGDINLAAYRYAEPAGFGVPGATVAGAVVFRAANDLTVNGSLTDGFLAPPDTQKKYYLASDATNWTLQSGMASPVSADVLLPASTFAVNPGLQLAPGTKFNTDRPIALNYDIVINSAPIKAGTVIPFSFTSADAIVSPPGGWITTAPIITSSGRMLPAGTSITGTLAVGAHFAAGTVLPTVVKTATDTIVPAGTLLSTFTGVLSLSQMTGATVNGVQTAALSANALVPANSTPIFSTTKIPIFAKGQSLDLRRTLAGDGGPAQGYLYPLAQLMPAGSTSWDISLVAGADMASAGSQALLPATQLNNGALTPAANTINAAPGSLILDDQHSAQVGGASIPEPAFSVIRTGTGNLSLLAGGSIDQSSLYGIYTSGTQAANIDSAFNVPRYPQGGSAGILSGTGRDVSKINKLLANPKASPQAYYPGGGGDVLVATQGALVGDLVDSGGTGVDASPPSAAVGNWLWRQGTTAISGTTAQPAAWWINFGNFVMPLDATGVVAGTVPQLVGFQGIGALGGGNVSVVARGDAGQIAPRGNPTGGNYTSGEGIVVAVGGTGRVTAGNPVPDLTGGGSLSVQIGGTLNPLNNYLYGTQGQDNLQGALVNLRGDTTLSAGAVGRIDPLFNALPNDPRPLNPFLATNGLPSGGIVVVPGDGAVNITTLRDLVLAGAGDPGRVPEQNLTLLSAAQTGSFTSSGGLSGFSLWTANSAIGLFAAGGNITPVTGPTDIGANGNNAIYNNAPTDSRYLYPPTLLATAASGSILYSGNATSGVFNTLETMPSANGQVAFLAGGSIIANGGQDLAALSIDISGADPLLLSTPLNPAFNGDPAFVSAKPFTNVTSAGGSFTLSPALQLFAFGADTPTSAVPLHQNDSQPARFYAGIDIIDFQTGETLDFSGPGNLVSPSTWYLAGKPVWIEAGGDIVSSGTRPSLYPGNTAFAVQQNYQATPIAKSSGNLFYNVGSNPISVVSAGRDILSLYAYVGGGGLLAVDAGRNLYQASLDAGTTGQLDFGSIKSIGSLVSGAPISLVGGASLAVLAGTGAGADYTALANAYLNPSNQANLALPLTDPSNLGKVQLVYTGALIAFLTANSGYTSAAGDPLVYFQTRLSAAEQDIFLRQVFFDELLTGGREYNDPASPFFHSYTRGRQAIDTLFPSLAPQSQPGTPAGYTGAITAFSGSLPGLYSSTAGGIFTLATLDGGFATLFGGGIQVLDPGGQIELGIPGGTPPGASSGIVTYGAGDVAIYARDSILLGQSRIFTTDGGNLQIWSSAGDINAGRGAATTVVFSPNVVSYDNVGDLTLTPTVPTNGAGIATLAPLPGITPGNVDLTAPGGTIDAGEAGIRVSGNLNLAAQTVVGGANISVKGGTTGAPTVSAPSAAAVQAASAATGAATSAANTANQRTAQPTDVASVIDVQVLSIGGGSDEDERKKRKPSAP